MADLGADREAVQSLPPGSLIGRNPISGATLAGRFFQRVEARHAQVLEVIRVQSGHA